MGNTPAVMKNTKKWMCDNAEREDSASFKIVVLAPYEKVGDDPVVTHFDRVQLSQTYPPRTKRTGNSTLFLRKARNLRYASMLGSNSSISSRKIKTDINIKQRSRIRSQSSTSSTDRLVTAIPEETNFRSHPNNNRQRHHSSNLKHRARKVIQVRSLLDECEKRPASPPTTSCTFYDDCAYDDKFLLPPVD